MPFILSSPAAAPPPTVSPGTRASARSGDQDASQPGSFGEAMARSREAGQEKPAEPVVRPAPAKTARRLADAEKAPAQDSVNPMAVLLTVPLESRHATAATAVPGGAAAAGPIENPEIPADAGLNNLLAAAPAAAGGLADASGIVGDTNAQAAISLGLGAILPKSADLAPAQVRATAARIGMPMAADPRAAMAQANAASAGLSDPSSGPGDDGANSTAAALDGRAEPLLEAADTMSFAGTASLAPPGVGALQQPGSLAASNTPAPVASALLTPEVGSSEWGKALGQQVIHLSAADRQVAELQLNPPGLGPLKVTLSMSDHQMQAAFVSAHGSVRAAVEAALPQLRALLAESGISLGQTSVGAESQSQTAFANSQGDSGGTSPRTSPRGREADKAALLFSGQPAALQRRPGQGLRIDTYA
ncbi:flagellar hook-length control protein FliK [Polaromonas sp. CG_9.11]|uniref:flagellar hook-length control protein FliK n=1 Tax=Polaromonas sp. CG_9.11 TaxID=2787730 RepID=UPI0018C97609|nr:flagellar hook-length control protein FliK [Polaromonas sp. CG_9.11]MBG6077607.1 flagellar hook-length control protein FliK [Polaromonas sp. CG_9.11]